jgi:dolichol-phosphate mannosyltransferase
VDNLKLISIIVPFLDEEESLPGLYSELCESINGLEYEFEIIFVDDGSSDSSAEKVLELRSSDMRVNLIRFSRNFGHQAALTAGMRASKGDAVICMDADLQHPPALIKDLIAYWQEGSEVVQTVRKETENEGALKKILSKVFYGVFRVVCNLDLPSGTADFRLLDRRVANGLLKFEEPPFWRAMTFWAGYKQKYLPYDAVKRKYGFAKYNFSKNITMAMEALFGYSHAPIAVLWLMAALTGLLGVVGIVDALTAFFAGKSVAGWASTIIISGFSMCSILVCLAVIATYVERIHRIVMHRPLYLIKDSTVDI